MSRIAGGPIAVGARGTAPWRTIRMWHIGCSLLVATGCPYVAPIREPPVNTPPDIEWPPTRNEDLLVYASTERIVLQARDDDGDNLYFYWGGLPTDLAGTALEPFSEVVQNEVIWTAMYELERDPELDGFELACIVSDLEDDVIQRWALTVEQ
jgi:hypothetical protein